MATLLIIKRWVTCPKCHTLQRLTPAPKYFCCHCGNPVNTFEEVTQMLDIQDRAKVAFRHEQAVHPEAG